MAARPWLLSNEELLLAMEWLGEEGEVELESRLCNLLLAIPHMSANFINKDILDIDINKGL